MSADPKPVRLTEAESAAIFEHAADYRRLRPVVERIKAAARREALERFADTRGVNVGDEDSEWWQGYRQAQRECVRDAAKAAEEAGR